MPSGEVTEGRTKRSRARATENSAESEKAKRGGSVVEEDGTGMRRQKEKGPRAVLPSRTARGAASIIQGQESEGRYHCRS